MAIALGPGGSVKPCGPCGPLGPVAPGGPTGPTVTPKFASSWSLLYRRSPEKPRRGGNSPGPDWKRNRWGSHFDRCCRGGHYRQSNPAEGHRRNPAGADALTDGPGDGHRVVCVVDHSVASLANRRSAGSCRHGPPCPCQNRGSPDHRSTEARPVYRHKVSSSNVTFLPAHRLAVSIKSCAQESYVSSLYRVEASPYNRRHTSRLNVTTIAAMTTVAPSKVAKSPLSVARLISAPSPVVEMVCPRK